MADRRHPYHSFPQNSTHNSFQQSHTSQPLPRSQHHNPRANLAPPEFGHHPVCSAWRDTPVRDPSSPEKRDGNVAESHDHQIQGPVRGPVRPQYGQSQGRPAVQQQQYVRPNAQGINHPASYNTQVSHPQPEFLTRVPSDHMNTRQQTNPRAFNTNTVMHEADMNKRDASHYQKVPSQEDNVHFRQPGHGAQHTSGPSQFTSIPLQHSDEHMNTRQQTNPRAFNANTVIHEADMNKRDASRYQKVPSQEDDVHFRQPGHGAQHTSGPNRFTSTSLQPPHDQLRAFPPPSAPPVGGISRSTMSGNQPMRGPKRMVPTEFQEKSYLGNGISRSDDSTHMGSYSQTHTSSTNPPVQQRAPQRRAETDHRREVYYENPSPPNMPDILQQQFERLGISDTQVVSAPTRTYQTATAMTPTGYIMRGGAQKAHGHDLDRSRTEFSYDVDLCRCITRDSDYAVAGGGCADIYTGTLSTHQTATKVAIKAIKMYSNLNDNNIKKKSQQLQREIEVWKKLDHHSVLKLLGTTSGFSPFPAMVCLWYENGTLTSYLERLGAELEMSRILGLIHEVASGLQYLHSRSVVHGDLSGSNVLIDEKGQACIADFGLSTILHESGVSANVAPSTGKPRATLRWAAPELLDLQEDGNTKSYTKPSDIYSFGGIMLQILSGKIPYHYYTRDAQVFKAISNGETTKRPNDPRVTERRWMFIQRCWSPFSVVYRRPSSDEIVTFSKDDLVGKDIQTGATGVVHGLRYSTR